MLRGSTSGSFAPVTLPAFTPEPWTVDALCAQTDPEAFFPEKGGSTKDAKRICGECEVAAECLAYALRNDERFGIWGGKSERERRKLKPSGGEPKQTGASAARSAYEGPSRAMLSSSGKVMLP